jgi:hypothetical protein
MRRAAATGINAGNILFLLLWYYGCIVLERLDPIHGGYLRRKYRKDRRPTFPVESPWLFYPRFVGGLIYKHARLVSMILRFGRFRQRLKRDPNARSYTDWALRPLGEESIGAE